MSWWVRDWRGALLLAMTGYAWIDARFAWARFAWARFAWIIRTRSRTACQLLDFRGLELNVEAAFRFDHQRDVIHRVPGRQIVAGGFRRQLEEWVLEHGAEYAGDFTHDRGAVGVAACWHDRSNLW